MSQLSNLSNESALHIRWPKYWSFSICPSNASRNGHAIHLEPMRHDRELARGFWERRGLPENELFLLVVN